MGVSGPSLLIESTDSMIYGCVRATSTHRVYQLYDTVKSSCKEYFNNNIFNTVNPYPRKVELNNVKVKQGLYISLVVLKSWEWLGTQTSELNLVSDMSQLNTHNNTCTVPVRKTTGML